MTYFLFLRGINVSGQKIIKMTELARILDEAGFTGVRTYLQSGNVACESTLRSTGRVRKRVEASLLAALGYEVTAIVRTGAELRGIVERDPFGGVKSGAATKYVTFFADAPPHAKLPLVSPKGNVTVVEITGADVCSLATTIPNGDYSNPWLEKLFKLPATTRNWKTVEKMVG